MPDVSILIATLNGAKTIGRSIESAQNQTVKDIEIVVVDDGSTDGTYDVVATMAAADPRIKCIRLPQNVGVGGARNVALANATGVWLTILDADDWYEPNRLEVLLKTARDEKADLVADNLEIYDHVRQQIVFHTNHGKKNQIVPLTAKDFFDGDNPLKRHPMGFIQPLIRRQFLLDHSIVYDQTHRVGEDFLFVAEILLRGARAFIVPGAYYVYVHRISPTTRKISPHSHSKVTAVFSLMVRGLQRTDAEIRIDHECRYQPRAFAAALDFRAGGPVSGYARSRAPGTVLQGYPHRCCAAGHSDPDRKYYFRFAGGQYKGFSERPRHATVSWSLKAGRLIFSDRQIHIGGRRIL